MSQGVLILMKAAGLSFTMFVNRFFSLTIRHFPVKMGDAVLVEAENGRCKDCLLLNLVTTCMDWCQLWPETRWEMRRGLKLKMVEAISYGAAS